MSHGEPHESSSAFAETAAVVDLRDVLVPIAVTGADAFDYMQRMVSGDLRKATESRGIRATLMSGKGRMVAAFEAYRDDDGILVIVESSAAEALQEALDKLVILEDVSLARGETVGVLLSVQGPTASDVIRTAYPDGALEPRPLSTGIIGGCRWMAHPRCTAGGWNLLVPAAEGDAVLARLLEAGAVRADDEVAEAHRIDAGIPRFGLDAGGEHMPPESGYDDAISYDKGCYAGQEVVARIRTYGHVNKQLRVLRVSGEVAPAPGDVVVVGDKQVGVVTSVAISPGDGAPVALGYVRLAAAEPGDEVTIAGDGRKVVARVAELGNYWQPVEA